MVVLGFSALLIRFTPFNHDVANGLNDKPVLMPVLVFSSCVARYPLSATTTRVARQ